MEPDKSLSYVVSSDLKVLARVTLGYAAMAMTVGGVPLVLVALTETGSIDLKEAIGAVGVSLFVLAILMCCMPWWWLQAARTRYEIEDGKLRFVRRNRVIEEFACDEVLQIRLDGFITWKTFLMTAGFGLSDFPRLIIQIDEKHVGPPILLWRGDVFEADQRLRSIVGHYRSERKRRATS